MYVVGKQLFSPLLCLQVSKSSLISIEFSRMYIFCIGKTVMLLRQSSAQFVFISLTTHLAYFKHPSAFVFFESDFWQVILLCLQNRRSLLLFTSATGIALLVSSTRSCA